MNRILEVCLIALTLAGSVGLASQAAPPLQTGITVDMPATNNAAAMPDADKKSALIVTVTRDGNIYVGVEPIDPEALSSELRARSTAGRTLYIKADARAPYAGFMKVLDAATAAGFEQTVLLTNQNDSRQAGTVSAPKGFAIVSGE